MDKKELLKLADSHQKKADANYRNYQETGIARYEYARRKAEEMADALRMAAGAADEHHEFISMKSTMANFVYRARMTRCQDFTIKERASVVEALVNEIISYGQRWGLIQEEPMKEKFTVIIEEHISGEFDVYADDLEDALKAAEAKYLQGEFVVEPATPNNRLMMARNNESSQATEWKEF